MCRLIEWCPFVCGVEYLYLVEEQFCHFGVEMFAFSSLCLGPEAVKSGETTLQRGGWDVKGSATSKHSTILWLLGISPKREKMHRSGDRTHDLRDFKNVSQILQPWGLVWGILVVPLIVYSSCQTLSSVIVCLGCFLNKVHLTAFNNPDQRLWNIKNNLFGMTFYCWFNIITILYNVYFKSTAKKRGADATFL